MSQFEAKLGEFAELGAKVFAISIDTHHSHRVFARELGLEFELLSDFNREFGRAYDLLTNVGQMKDALRRSLWVISKGDRMIRYKEVTPELRILPDPEPALAVLREIVAST